LCAGLLLAVCAVSLRAKGDDLADAAAVKGQSAYSVRGEDWQMLQTVLKFPQEVEVNTNGEFTVAGGKARKLLEGQLLLHDGWIVYPDGSIEPVVDHVQMKAGRVIVVRDGVVTTVTAQMTFPNGLSISPDGWADYPSGSHARLADGQLFRMDGSPIPAKDTVTLKGGAVVVQKDGSLIRLVSNQIMGMNDGTKVQGDGFLVRPDGTVIRLYEGETVFVEGRAARQ
jgi:hypothetical protein